MNIESMREKFGHEEQVGASNVHDRSSAKDSKRDTQIDEKMQKKLKIDHSIAKDSTKIDESHKDNNNNAIEAKDSKIKETESHKQNITEKSDTIISTQKTTIAVPHSSNIEADLKEQPKITDDHTSVNSDAQISAKNSKESKLSNSVHVNRTDSMTKSEQNHQHTTKHEDRNITSNREEKPHGKEKPKVGFKNKNHSKPLPDFVVSSQEVKMLENISSRKYYSNDVSPSGEQRVSPFYSIEYSTMLFHAVSQNDCFAIAALLQKGGNVNAQLTGGDSVLLYAVKNNKVEAAKYLVLKGADINLQNSYKETPLHIAIKSKNLECTSLLLYYNADVLIKDKDGKTPLSYLRGSDTSFCIQVFSMYTNKEKALIDATRMGLLSSVRYIIKSGIKPTITDENGNTLLILAVKNGDIKMVSLLLEYGGEQLKIANKAGETAMSVAAKNNYTDITSILKTFQIQEEFRKS
ncbi:ankyrin repeat domain-containing protein [Candidatus Fokinia solitaria]|nr:ankyrin repeat domain-containing protein [Candidatus Fokinia solitaria]